MPLAAGHALDDFRCRSDEQTTWLRRHARQASAAGTTRTFVVVPAGGREVVAYYAWCMAHLTWEGAPDRVRRGAGRYPQLVALLARLGVDVDHERRGLGAALVGDVVLRLLAVADEIGCRGLLIHCADDDARRFYRHLLPDLEASPTDDLHLVLLAKDARRSLR